MLLGKVWVPQPRLRSLAKAWSRKHSPRHRDLALSTPMINVIIPQIIIQMEIISPACWNGPCTTAWPCGMEKGAEGFIHQGVPKGGSEGESASEAAGDQALVDGAASACKHERKLKLLGLSSFSCS